ncbi:site-specific integrase [Catenuloplanes japonicus]|uniref:site-specific integrase n=1 Tax=Catenuloplanes japonicus TaxID=33876 RepID=UPI000524021C|nr:site-specific integrase [Catenuloplanes japonicus]
MKAEDQRALRMLFVTSHPVLPVTARVALTLALVSDLSTTEIADAYRIAEPTVARRIRSGKRTLAAAGVPFALPSGPERADRLRSVLEVLRLIYVEGDLREEALRLARMLAQLLPAETEVSDLIARLDQPRADHHGGTLRDSTRDFLAGRAASTRRSYAQTLDRLRTALGDDTPLTALTADRLARACRTAWNTTAPATWNRHRATVRSFAAWAGLPGLATGLERRADARTPGAPPTRAEVLALGADPAHPLRDRTLWLMLHESGAPVTTVLGLDVQDLDLDDRHAPAKGVTWRSATARLLPELIGTRTRGPLFLTGRRPGPARTPADAADLCPDTGRRRLSYERAAYLCKRATGSTLSRLSPTQS